MTDPPPAPPPTLFERNREEISSLIAFAVIAGLFWFYTSAEEPATSRTDVRSPSSEVVELDGEVPASEEMPGVWVVGSSPSLDAGDGQVSVVAGSELSLMGGLPVVVVNGSDRRIEEVRLAVTIRTGDGTLAGSGESDFTIDPYSIPPGGLGIGRMWVEGSLPDDAEVEFTVTNSHASSSYFKPVALEITEVAVVDGSVSVRVTNATSVDTESSTVSVVCFAAGDSVPTRFAQAYSSVDLSSGDTTTLTTRIGDCAALLLTARGHRL